MLPFHCECEGERCRERVSLTPDYLWIRAHRGWLIVAPGHVVAGAVAAQRVSGSFVLETRRDGLQPWVRGRG